MIDWRDGAGVAEAREGPGVAEAREGPGVADGREEGAADGREERTPDASFGVEFRLDCEDLEYLVEAELLPPLPPRRAYFRGGILTNVTYEVVRRRDGRYIFSSTISLVSSTSHLSLLSHHHNTTSEHIPTS